MSSSSSPARVPETARERNNRIVKDLADRVVKGWTLLNSTCPTCQTALLRSREGQVYCVGCRMPVVTEAEARQRNLTPSTPSSNPSTQDSQPPPSAAPPTAAPASPTPQIPSPVVPPSRASSFASPSAGAFHGRGDGLVGLSSAPHFAELSAQLRELNGHREDAPLADSPPVPASATTSASVGSSPRVQRQQARTNNLSAKLGEKMMQGWTLMGVHCADPQCLCPLVRKPRSTEMQCVACGADYTDEGSDAPSSASASSQPSHTASASSVSAQSTSQASSATAASSPPASSPFVLHVNGSPQPASRAQSAASGLNRRRWDDEEEEEDEDEPTRRANRSISERPAQAGGPSAPSPSSATAPPSTISSQTSSAASPNAPVGVSEVSARLSEKLLQGWTMLAQECPNPSCSCPLVRKKSGPMQCVQCGSTVVTQEEKNQMDSATQAAGSVAAPTAQPEEKDHFTASSQPPPSLDRPHSKSTTQKRTAFAGTESDEGKKRAKEGDEVDTDAFSDRLSSLSSSSLVHTLGQSPLVRPTRPSAISSSRKFAPTLHDSSPSTRTPPTTPAPFPFSSPLPSSQHLSASISSAFSAHPVYPPPGHITRANSQTSDYSAFPQQNVGLGTLYMQAPATLPAQRQQLHTPGGHEKGKFSFRASSAAAATGATGTGGGGKGDPGHLHAPQQLTGVGGTEAGGVVTPVTGVSPLTGVSPVHHIGGGSGGAMGVVQASIELLYGKLDLLRGLLSSCGSVEQVGQIAVAMREVAHALKALQSL